MFEEALVKILWLMRRINGKQLKIIETSASQSHSNQEPKPFGAEGLTYFH
jgi:hypothetical protein